MQVIVCDDDIENLNEMIQVCHDVLAKGTEVRGFSDASMLAEALQAGMVQPALLLLDIEMPALTGLELREQMASKLRMTDIIYVTSHEEMMEAAFGRNVIAFVRKVGNWDRLSEVLHNFQQEHQCMVDVTWKKKVWQIDVSQILYIQSGGLLFAGRACAGIAVLYDEGVGADFTGTGILQDIKICDRELCVCRGHPEDISNYGR